MSALHLVTLDGNEGARAEQDPRNDPKRLVSEGRYGCDYAWNADFTAYRCMPHRWVPGSDSSYAAWQAGDMGDE